jgi:hypothetical protein
LGRVSYGVGELHLAILSRVGDRACKSLGPRDRRTFLVHGTLHDHHAQVIVELVLAGPSPTETEDFQ